ncbi:MAG: hypothetical protein LQ346_000959 [Caloplaca aetnensis]|nr:MAG: hypothetical protein LQ346_000959 [Caloplaca aetnensis]
MQLQLFLAGLAAFAMGISPALALPEPEAIPELLEARAQCIGGHHLVGSGCGPNQNGKTSCSANDPCIASSSQKSTVLTTAPSRLRLDHLRPRRHLEDSEQVREGLLQQQLRLSLGENTPSQTRGWGKGEARIWGLCECTDGI